MCISVSDIVRSLAGRDKDKIYFVLSKDDNFLSLIDGRSRPIANPKRKKRKHVALIQRSESPVAHKLKSGDTVLDSEIRRALTESKGSEGN